MGRLSGSLGIGCGVLALSLLVLAGAAGATAQSPSPSATPEMTFPPPPAWFAPGMLRVVTGLEFGPDLEDGVWLAGIDGSGAREVLPSAFEAVLGAGDVVVAVVAKGDGFVIRLVFPDGSSIDSVTNPWAGIGLDPDRDSAFVTMVAARGDREVKRLMRVDLRDGSATVLLPWRRSAQQGAVESPDGRWLAWGVDAGEELISFVRYRGRDGKTRSLGRGEPIGFDLLGRLWYRALSTNGRPSLARVDLRTGMTRTIRRLTSHDLAQVVTSDGRSLVTLWDDDGAGHVRVTDLVDGDHWSITIPRGSALLDATGRYLLFHSVQGDTSGTTVIDTVEHWAGFVPRTLWG